MSDKEAEQRETEVALETLIRLANSCDRAAARGQGVMQIAADLNAEDYRDIADILRRLTRTIDSQPI